jgi:carbamoylphosphate synthase large subunit
LYHILEKEKPDVLIPLTDHHINYISSRKKEIEKKFRVKVITPDRNSFLKIFDKIKAYDLSKFGLRFPKRFQSLSSLNHNDFPIFIKPNIGAGGFLAKKINDLEEAKEHIKRILRQNKKPLIQEYMWFKRGGVLNLFCYNGNIIDGHCVVNFNRKYEKIKKFLKLVEKTAKNLRWTGFLSLQFRVDTNGVFFVQEINPRTSMFIVNTYLFFDWENILKLIKTNQIKKIKIRFYDYFSEIRKTREEIKGHLYLAKKFIITIH